jgi:hypothetical protein
MKPGFSIDQHVEMGLRLKRIRAELRELCQMSWHAYPKTSRVVRTLDLAAKWLNRARFEEEMFEEHGSKSLESAKLPGGPLHVYFGPDTDHEKLV